MQSVLWVTNGLKTQAFSCGTLCVKRPFLLGPQISLVHSLIRYLLSSLLSFPLQISSTINPIKPGLFRRSPGPDAKNQS